MPPTPITDIPIKRMPALVAELGLKPYAAGQIVSWLYQKRVTSFEEMTNLSGEARVLLARHFSIAAVEVEKSQLSADGTKKFLCRTRDGTGVECVLIPAEDGRVTVCLSTQAGCAMGCTFCRTGGMGFVRNLSPGEILGQLIVAARAAVTPVTNLVLMGMGEPLANVEAVGHAVEALLDERAFGLSKRRVTLSTCGLLPELAAFVRDHDIKIAISLNATTDAMREQLMPVNRRYPIGTIMAFCRDYCRQSRHRVTFEYVLMGSVNDSPADILRLADHLRGIRAKVNLIPFNPFAGCAAAAPDSETIERWRKGLWERGIQVNVRFSRGQEILAACGQLAGE